MPIPEGFTRAMLGLPEEDNRRNVERTSTGMWHILTDRGPATVFDSKVTASTSVYMGGQFAYDHFSALTQFGPMNIVDAPDEAIEALRWAGYEFEDRRKPA